MSENQNDARKHTLLAFPKTPTAKNTITSYLRKHQRPKTQLARLSENDNSPRIRKQRKSERGKSEIVFRGR